MSNNETIKQYKKDWRKRQQKNENWRQQQIKRHKQYRRDNQDYLRKKCLQNYYTPKGRMANIKAQAKKCNIDFNLTLEQFNQFWQKPCYYCKAEIKTAGLDRIDNKKGYIVDNLNPCCKNCNALKGLIEAKKYNKGFEKILISVWPSGRTG